MDQLLVLPVSLRKKGCRLVWREDTGSTNADALQSAREGHDGSCWFVAGQQGSGRGRSGRRWESPPGNLYASLFLLDPCEMQVAPQLGFVAGIALYDAIVQLSGVKAPRLQLKWPNDVLLDGGKLAGLLLESQIIGNRRNIIIGFGVNIARKPEGMPYPVAALQEANAEVTVGELFASLSLAFDSLFSLWKRTEGRTAEKRFSPIRSLWLERAAGIGSPAIVNLPQGRVSGTFAGIDDIGRLQLETNENVLSIDAGDLFFPSIAT